jgi:anti-sigma28 factor (negative regulator of flagellin synthesis)
MRLDLNNPIARQLAAELDAKKSSKPEVPSATVEDGTTFSQRIPSMQVLMQDAMKPSDVRYARIAALRDAYRNGTYSTDADTSAEAMLKESE